MILVYVIFCLVLSSVGGQIAINGTSCPGQCINNNISITNDKLEGVWYLQYNVPKFFEHDMKCTFLNITEIGDKHLHYDKYEFHNDTSELRQTIGTIEYFDEDGLTIFFYTELSFPFDYHTIALTDDYWVLTVCLDCGFYEKEGSGIYAKVFTRLQYPQCKTQAAYLDALANCGIDVDSIPTHAQDDCPFC